MIWEVDPFAIHTGVFSMRWYGIFLSSGLIAGFFHLRWLVDRAGHEVLFDDVALYGFVGGIIGARLGQFAFYEPQALIEHPLVLVSMGAPGLAGHGAIIGVCLAMLPLARRHKPFPYVFILSAFALSYVVFCVVVRIGNFFNSELVGVPASVPWAVKFVLYDGQYRHPVQLYESLAYLAAYPCLLWVHRRLDSLGSFATTLTVMSFLRIVLEAFKEKQSGLELATAYTLGQYLSVPLLLLGIMLLLVSLRRERARSL